MDETSGNNIHSRITELEVEFASTRSDIKSLFNIVKSVSDKLDNMDIRNRPNTLALFGAAISLVVVIATVGALAFAPAYRAIDDMKVDDRIMAEALVQIQSTRFTPDDARELRTDHDQDMGGISSSFSKRLDRQDDLIHALVEKVAYLEGWHKGEHAGD